jgi:DNA-directed RNA polymerase subunit E'/Rpb7
MPEINSSYISDTTVEINSPYINTEYKTRINLEPSQLNNDIYENLKANLTKQLEKKCNKHGYIVKIYKIINHSDGHIEPENFSASAVFNVTFNCRICIPLKNTKLICKVDELNRALVTAENGPITVIILKNDINKNNFTIDTNDVVMHKDDRVLKKGDIVKITVMAKKFHINDSIIKVIGHLDDYASESEIKQFETEIYGEDNVEFI